MEIIFDIEGIKEKIIQKEQDLSSERFWKDGGDFHTKTFKDIASYKKIVAKYEEVLDLSGDIDALFELLSQEDDEDLLKELKGSLLSFQKYVTEIEMKSALSGEYDSLGCYFSIYSGAGGTDAQDWVSMMLRMYLRWAESKEYKVEVTDQLYGEEAGLKSVTVFIEGDYAYGYLQTEAGVHRLVRISPFNVNNKRQTSFAAVEVLPDLKSENTDCLEIDTKDLKIDTFRASGAGGQHVNKTDSAVRITHLPTGIVSTSQCSRSQLANKETAMKMLKSRLLIEKERERREHMEGFKEDSKDNSWGNQIRSYVLHPYKLVKDLRTGHETTDIKSVLDGELDVFIRAKLLHVKEA